MRVFGINAETGQKVWRYKGHTRRVRAVTICKDEEDVGDSVVFTTSDDDTVRVLRAEDGEEQWVSRWGWMAKASTPAQSPPSTD
jgi:outer membrane protein assembly factor BamB